MSEKISETLKKLADDTLKASSVTDANELPNDRPAESLGDPECPHCGGSGYTRRELPYSHPDFGRLEICVCRQPQVQARIRQRLFSMSHLEELKDLTFDSFHPRGRVGLAQQQQESIERAFNQTTAYADVLDGWLLILGPYGSGKTHLAAAIANESVAKGVPTLFLTVPDLLDSLRFSYNAEDVTFEQRFEQIRSAPLLVLDDFGTHSATEWAGEKLFQILNYRYINHLPLVVTSNMSLEEMEGRIRSRLSDPDLVAHVHIHAPDYRRPIDDEGQHELSSLHVHVDQTFGTFSERKGEKLPSRDLRTLTEAFQAAREFADQPKGWLVFMGPYGCGKTHLAAGIANYRASQGYPVMFVVVPDLLDHLRATFNPKSTVSYDRRFEDIRATQLLVLDDLGTQAATPWVREKLYQLFNHRYNASLPTVITTASREDELDPRLLARMLDRRICVVKKITAPPYRGRRNPRR